MNEKRASFEKDLGYLDRFFDNLQAHAAEALGEDQGAALSRFIEEERVRWADIRAMIQGEGAGAPGPAVVADGAKPDGAETGGTGPGEPGATPSPAEEKHPKASTGTPAAAPVSSDGREPGARGGAKPHRLTVGSLLKPS